MSFDVVHIAEVRRIVQLENVRSGVYALAAETLGGDVERLSVSCDVDADGSFGLSVSWFGPGGVELGGQTL